MTRILSLDDEPGMLDLLGLILERTGCEHQRTTSVYEAWAILHSEPIDLFTQDLSRPDMDGWRFLHLMKADEASRDVPVILITARLLKDQDLHQATSQADAYINKPFGPKDLLTTIEMVLTRRGKPLPKANHKLHKPPPGNGKAPTAQDWLDGVQSDDWKRRWKAALGAGAQPRCPGRRTLDGALARREQHRPHDRGLRFGRAGRPTSYSAAQAGAIRLGQLGSPCGGRVHPQDGRTTSAFPALGANRPAVQDPPQKQADRPRTRRLDAPRLRVAHWLAASPLEAISRSLLNSFRPQLRFACGRASNLRTPRYTAPRPDTCN